MKQVIIILLTAFAWASCSNESSSVAKQTSTSDSLKQNFSSILNGVWVLTSYVDAIEKTKSPLKSAEKLQGVVALKFNDANQSDSVAVDASLNNHEGYTFAVYFQAGQNKTHLKTGLVDYEDKSTFYELGYETIGSDLFVFLYHYNKANTLLDKEQFSKIAVNQNANDPSSGLQYVVNEKIFSGDYVLLDTKNASSTLSLKSDGTITGHGAFTTYSVATDFMGGPVPSFDELIFNPQTKTANTFAFKQVNDTTFLYRTTGNEDAGEALQLGNIAYKLVRQNK